MSKDSLSFAIIEDSDLDYDLIMDYLQRQGFKFTSFRISDRSGFELFLSENEPDLIISDFNLPGFNALDALGAIREKWKNLPFIIISGSLGEESLVDLFKSGATDFILKDRLFRLGPAITRSLEDKQHKSALEASETKVLNLLREKNALLRELHDRVKNNLQVMLSIMRMELDSITDENEKIRIQRLRDRIWSMALIHKEIYNVEDFTCIDFQVHVGRLIADMSDFYRCTPDRVAIVSKVGECNLSIKAAMPCAMLTQEVLSLMLGYECMERKGGEITIDFSLKHDRYHFSVTDNGKGLLHPYNDTVVTEMSRLMIMQSAHQLGGDLQFSFEKGFSVSGSFPRDIC
jgi:two-component sensor histidine kinase/CheY-like chemotaxis protein